MFVIDHGDAARDGLANALAFRPAHIPLEDLINADDISKPGHAERWLLSPRYS